MNFSAVPHETFFGRALRLPLKLIPPNATIPILQGVLRGKRWVVGSCEHGCWLGSYEYATQQVLASLIQPGNTVYDLGANVGFYTLLASTLVGSTGKVYSFEPVPRNLHYLRRHLDLNRVLNCAVLEVAVGQQEATGRFDLGYNSVSGHLTTNGADTNAITVRIVALDQLLASGHLSPPNVIKCDVEGAEFHALMGATKILKSYRPTIVLATHNSEVHRQCQNLLVAHRYEITYLENYHGDDRQLLATPA